MKSFPKVLLISSVVLLALLLLPYTGGPLLGVLVALCTVLAIVGAALIGFMLSLLAAALLLIVVLSPLWIPVLLVACLIGVVVRLARPATAAAPASPAAA